MIERNEADPILELRVALTTSDFERMTKFYFEALGIQPAQFWDNGQGQAVVLNMGVATLEIFDENQAQTIDQIETGKRVSGQVRFALQVPDLNSATVLAKTWGNNGPSTRDNPLGGHERALLWTRTACKLPSSKSLRKQSRAKLGPPIRPYPNPS